MVAMPDSSSLDNLHMVADTLAAGFQALLEQVEEQKQIEDKLRRRLEQAAQKYEDSCNSSSAQISVWREEIVRQIDSPRHDSPSIPPVSDANIAKAKEVIQHLSEHKMPAPVQPKRCPVAHKITDQEDFERDFTTPGRIGDLGCPFAQMAGEGGAICGPDPIAEEFHGEKASGRSKSSGAAGDRCPIRFLDQHSPEEVAQYFENHKHEIPRSHQICVKRYQQNEQSIRQLDAKYGSLVSMIQGLGNKHKQFLPNNSKVADEPEQDSVKAVERWAEDVSHRSVSMQEPNRTPRFERPLRDIRVGESPSRPWGISVPLGKSPAASALPSDDDAVVEPKPVSNHAIPVLDEKASDAPAKATKISIEPPKHRPEFLHQQPQIVFNGPVFFGYSAEQAALFLKNLNIAGDETR